MRRISVGLVVLALASVVLCSACRCEERLRPSNLVPEPTWTIQPPESEAGVRYYVGIALGDNILEEMQARRRAIANAAERVAQDIAADVRANITRIDAKDGADYKGENEDKGRIYDDIKAKSAQLIVRLNPIEYWREKWFVREKVCTLGFTRYKMFVLCSFPETEYKRLLAETLKR